MNTEEIKEAFIRSHVSKFEWSCTEKGYKEDLLVAEELKSSMNLNGEGGVTR